MGDGGAPSDSNVTVLGEKPASRTPAMGELFLPHAGKALGGIVWLIITNGLLLAIPRLVNEGVAAVEGTTPKGGSVLAPLLGVFGADHTTIGMVVGAVCVAAVIGAVARVMSRIVLFNVGRDVERELRSVLFSHLSTLSPTYYRKSSVGDLMSRLTNDMTNVRLMAGFALLNAMNASIVFIANVPLMISLDAKVALLALTPFPFIIVAAQTVSRSMFRRTKETQEALGKLTAAVQENLAGQQVVRAFSREDDEVGRFHASADAVYVAAMRLAKIRLAMGPVMAAMGSLSIGVSLYAGGRAIIDGRLAVGDVVEMNARLIQLAWPMIAMGFIVSVYQRGKASLARINEVLAVRPDIVDGAHTGALDGRIRAKGLTIEVAPGVIALKDLDVSVAPGRVLGIVGKNASGKSTLLRALARQVPCPRDQLFVDDVDVNDWDLRALHQGIGVVPEDGFLFSATLRENLAFGRADASDADVDAVVDLCDLRRDVESFPDKLSTVVGERGVTLSGGQRQRTALGRAILARPSILLLDDCLSAVDAETEANIVGALRRGFAVDGGTARVPTLVVVSHRLSAVRDADEIVVLDKGEVIERGTHDALLAKGGLYADLWGKEQLRKQMASAAAAE